MSQYFPKPFNSHFGESIKVKIYLSNYATKTDIKIISHVDTSEFNKLAIDAFNARLAQVSLITKTDFDAKLSSFNRKITENKSKHLLAENESNKLKTFDSSYFIGKSHFGEDGTQNYLVF